MSEQSPIPSFFLPDLSQITSNTMSVQVVWVTNGETKWEVRVYWGNLTLGKLKREETEATEKAFKLWYRSDTYEKNGGESRMGQREPQTTVPTQWRAEQRLPVSEFCVWQKGPGPYGYIKLSHWLGLAIWELGLTIMCWGRSWRHCSWMLLANAFLVDEQVLSQRKMPVAHLVCKTTGCPPRFHE